MTSITTLLVARDPIVVHDVQKLHDEVEFARLEVRGRVEKFPTHLSRDCALVLVHADPVVPAEQVRAFLVAADRSLVKAVVVMRRAPGDARTFAPYPVYDLDADATALRELLMTTHVEASRAQARPTPAPLVDPITAALYGHELKDFLARIRRVAGQPTTVLLTGETGSGKTMLAKFIHAASPRSADPYLVVDCGALAGHLIESEMFGHVRGAFTGAERDRQGKFGAAGPGTLVLDEVNSLPLPLQAKLLRAVEERVFEPVGSNKSEELRARLVAISNVPLEDEIRRGRFRSDLYYRLNVVEFRVPPLRERPASVIPLAHQLLRASATGACQGVTAIAPDALEAMLGYDWPGNVRELRNVIERAAALAAGPVIQLADLPETVRGKANPTTIPMASFAVARPPVERYVHEPLPEDGADEAARIVAVLRKHNNNRRRAAAELGMSRVSLYKKLHRFGLFVRKCRAPQVG